MRARSTKYDPKIQIFAFYCIFSLQFSKVSEGPGPHGPHTYEALVFRSLQFERSVPVPQFEERVPPMPCTSYRQFVLYCVKFGIGLLLEEAFCRFLYV